MNLNLPIGVLRSLMTMHPDHTSPAVVEASQMSDVIVETPVSPGNRPSPRDAVSPMAIVDKIMSANERAFLFVEEDISSFFDQWVSRSNGECAVGYISKLFIKAYTGQQHLGRKICGNISLKQLSTGVVDL
jgi:hypothetical protein